MSSLLPKELRNARTMNQTQNAFTTATGKGFMGKTEFDRKAKKLE